MVGSQVGTWCQSDARAKRNAGDSGLDIPLQQLQILFMVFAHFSNIADSAFELPNGCALTLDLPSLRDAIQVTG